MRRPGRRSPEGTTHRPISGAMRPLLLPTMLVVVSLLH
jgi:hypothetical protein